MFFRETSIPLSSNNSFAIQQKSPFNRSKSHLNSPFMDFFPLRKIIFFEVGLFFIQWMLKTNIPTSPFPLWEHMIRSKRDILLLHLNHLQTVYCQNNGSLFCASLSCVLKKNDFFGAANVKSQKGMILAGELQFYQLPIGISLLTPCCKRGNTTKAEMDATSIQHPPHAGAIYNNFKV